MTDAGRVIDYPVSLRLRGRHAVVIGGGALAEQKVSSLLAAACRVTVIAEMPTDRLDALATRGDITLHRRGFRDGDLAGAFLAIAASDDRSLNHRIWREAESRGVLLNAVDDAEHCHFTAPAIHRHGQVTVAVSTGGSSPALAVRLRQAIARVVRPEHGQLAELLGARRGEVAQRVPDLGERRRLWFEIVDSDLLGLLRRRKLVAARTRLDALVRPGSTTAVSTRATPGIVSLVGAGPGRAGYITVAGRRALRRAEVVVYDRLTHPALRALAAPDALRIGVGKRPGRPGITQDAINALLVRLARQGLRVVRLKGGDPFVFGRGAEEVQALRAAGVRYEVIPGVSAAIAAPGAAGIPVTHRAHASAFAVVTGTVSDAAPPLDWDALARLPTLVVMMGVGALPAIVARLRGHGMPHDTPAAVIAHATRRRQRTIVGTLDDIAVRAADARLEPPATLVVGAVVRVGEGAVAPQRDMVTHG